MARPVDEPGDVRGAPAIGRQTAGVFPAGALGGPGVSPATSGVGEEKSTETGSRSVASVISKNSRGVNPPMPAITELGNTWILVLYDWTLPL